MIQNTNLLKYLKILRLDPQRFDGDFLVAISAIPDINDSTKRDRPIARSGKFTGHDIRGWQSRIVATDSLQLV